MLWGGAALLAAATPRAWGEETPAQPTPATPPATPEPAATKVDAAPSAETPPTKPATPPAAQPTHAPSVGDSLPEKQPYETPVPSAPFLMRGPRETRKIALTFDDGPSPGITEMVLDALKAHGGKATFFMIGNRVKASPKLAERVHSEGHEIANHSMTHPALAKMSKDRVQAEIGGCQEVIRSALGVTPTWFRPPYGSFRTAQGPLASALHVSVVIWSVDPRDWARPGVQAITQRVLSQTDGGDIVLCHDLHRQTAEAAHTMIGGLKAKGYELVTLSDLIFG